MQRGRLGRRGEIHRARLGIGVNGRDKSAPTMAYIWIKLSATRCSTSSLTLRAKITRTLILRNLPNAFPANRATISDAINIKRLFEITRFAIDLTKVL